MGNAAALGGVLLALLLWPLLRPLLLKLSPAGRRAPTSSEEEQPDGEELGIGGFRVSTTPLIDVTPMPDGAAQALIARVSEAKATGDALYQSKDWAASVRAYSVGLKLAPDLEEEKVPLKARQACAVLYTGRSAARYELQQYVGSLSDAQHAQEFDREYWAAHWRVGSALLMMEARVERSEQMVKAFELCVASPTLPEAQREKMGKYLENSRHRLKTGKDMYEAADCVVM